LAACTHTSPDEPPSHAAALPQVALTVGTYRVASAVSSPISVGIVPVSWKSCTNLRPRRPPPPHRAFDRMHSLKSRGGYVWALGGVHLHQRQRRQQPDFRGDGSRYLPIQIPAQSPHHPLYLNTVALVCMQRPRQREGGKRTRRYIRNGRRGTRCNRLIPPLSLRLRTARRWWTPPAKTARGARATPKSVHRCTAACCMSPCYLLRPTRAMTAHQ